MTTCGPVAIINALRWAGQKAPYSLSKSKIRKACKWNSGKGTRHTNFEKALRKFGGKYFSIRKKKRPTLKEMRKHLSAGQAIVLSYAWESGGERSRHFSLLIPHDGFVYRVNSYRKGPAAVLVGEGSFRRYELRFQRTKECGLVGWFLNRRER